MKTLEMALLSNSRWQNRKERSNRKQRIYGRNNQMLRYCLSVWASEWLSDGLSESVSDTLAREKQSF